MAADAEVKVLVTAQEQGFEQLEGRLKNAQESLKRMGDLTRAGGSTNSGPYGAMARQIDEATKKMQEFRKQQDSMWNGRNIGFKMGESLTKGMQDALKKPISLPQQFFSSMTSGIQKAVSQGVQQGWNQAFSTLKKDPMAALAVGAVAKDAVTSTLNPASDREQVRLNLAGTGLLRNPAQASVLENMATDLSRKYKNVSTTEELKFITDSLKIFGGTGDIFTNGGTSATLTPEAKAMYDQIAGLQAFMKTFKGGEHAGAAMQEAAQFANAIRSGELKGYSATPLEMAKWVKRLTAISIAQGVSPTDMIAAQRTAGSAFLGLDDNAINMFAAYTQENKQRAGVQLMGFVQRLVGGGSQTSASNAMLMKLGILDPNDVKNHPEAFDIKNGQVTRVKDTSYYKDWRLAGTNPWEFMAKDLYPGLRKAIKDKTGKDIGDIDTAVASRSAQDLTDLFQKVGGTFGNRNTASFVTEGIIQYSNLKKRGGNITSTDIDQAARSASYLSLTQQFSGQLNDFQTNIGLVFLPLVTKIMPYINSALGHLADMVKGLDGSIGPLGTAGVLLGGGYLAGGRILTTLFKSPVLRMMAFMGAGAFTGGGILPYLLAGSLMHSGGLGGGAGGLAEGGALAVGETAIAGAGGAAAVGKLSGWLRFIPRVGAIMRMMTSIVKAATSLPGMLAIGGAYSAITSDTGQDIIDWFRQSAKYAWKNATGTATEADKTARDQSYRKAQNDTRALIGMPSVEDEEAQKRQAQLDADKIVRKRAGHIKRSMYGPYEPYGPPSSAYTPPPHTFIAPPLLGRRGAFNQSASGGAGGGGPIPVVVQSMPKGQDRPNNISITNNVNVTTNATGADIAGAVGSATKAAATSALHDVHH